MKKNAVQYIKSLCLSAVAFAATSAALAAEKLYVYNWTDYVPSNLVAEFTKETGIEVIYSTFESNAIWNTSRASLVNNTLPLYSGFQKSAQLVILLGSISSAFTPMPVKP